MARSKETFNKRDKEKQRAKAKQEKAEKMQERRANAQKGKSLDEMMAYLDEDGNISSTPPDPRKAKVFKQEDMQIGVPKQEDRDNEPTERTGVLNFFNEAKGFGFINDQASGERVFVHVNQITEPIYEGDKLTFEVENGPKGLQAINVRKAAK